MFHDLQRLIARLFPGPDWSLPCAGLPLSAGAKALQPLPEPRLQKRSARSRSRVTSVRSIAGRPTWLQRLSTPLGQQAPLTPVLPTSLINLNLGRKGGAGLTRNTNVCVCVCVCVWFGLLQCEFNGRKSKPAREIKPLLWHCLSILFPLFVSEIINPRE